MGVKPELALGTPKLKGEFELEQRSDQFNDGTRMKQQIHEEYNSGRNLAPILAMFAEGRARDLDDEPKVDKTPFFCIGSGGGLDDAIPYLKDWKGGIFCSTSHALTLMYHGIEPTHLLALDPFSMYEEIDGIDWSKTKTKLITHPGVWPDLLARWPNDVLLYRQDMGRADSFYATTQMHMYTERKGDRQNEEFEFRILIKTTMSLFACSPPAQLFAADHLGYGICFFAGMNFAYDTGKERFTSYEIAKRERPAIQVGNAPAIDIGRQEEMEAVAAWEKADHRSHTPTWKPRPAETVAPGVTPLLDADTVWKRREHPYRAPDTQEGVREQDQVILSTNGLPTTQLGIFYKKNLISSIRLAKKTCYTCDRGALVEVPFMDIRRVVTHQGRKAKIRREKQIKLVTERYLARSGAFVIETPDERCQFIESPNPEVELVQHIKKMNSLYTCEQCQLQAVDETGNGLPADQKCPRCGAGFKAKFNIDLSANMNRIFGLLAWVRSRPGAQ